MLDRFVDAVEQRSVVVGVVGLGYVGVPLVEALLRAGHQVVGLDVDRERVERLREGRHYVEGADASLWISSFSVWQLHLDCEPDVVSRCDAVIVCVPTPLGDDRQPQLRYVDAAMVAVARHLRRGALVVLESTTYPGCTRERVLPTLEHSGLQHGEGFLLAYSPEREDPGSGRPLAEVPKLVGGITPEACAAAVALYGTFVHEVVSVASCEVAEAAKLVENVYRCVNIALVNELKEVLEPLGVDARAAITAAATKPFGFMPFWPGPGVGGHCIPVDPIYLAWAANRRGQRARFVELATEVNRRQPRRVVDVLTRELGREGVAAATSRVLVLGLTYKPGVADTREAPAEDVLRLMREAGYQPLTWDPLLPAQSTLKPFAEGDTAFRPDVAYHQHAIVVLVRQPGIDWEAVAMAPLVIDTCGALEGLGPRRARVVSA